jgi:DNA-binding NarL/FixJ family response regulator
LPQKTRRSRQIHHFSSWSDGQCVPTVSDMEEPGARPSPRELEVVGCIVEGLSSGEIAERLGVSQRTVHAHVSKSMQKTGTRTRTQLAVHALRAGLVPFEPKDSGPACCRARAGEGEGGQP